MDKEMSSNIKEPGIAIQNGPVGNQNGVNGKRKSRGSIAKPTYIAESSDEDDIPLVRILQTP
jgi:hypothetical protein